jgi:hypothetical protein
MPVILATQEAKIRRIAVRSQPGKIVPKTLSQTKSPKKGLAEQCIPEFKHQYYKKCQFFLPFFFYKIGGGWNRSVLGGVGTSSKGEEVGKW